MKTILYLILTLSIVFSPPLAAQSFKSEIKTPNPDALASARKACTDLFSNLAAGKTEEIASWISNEVGYTRNSADKMTMKSDFKSKLDLVVTSPPVTPYGKLSGYDLINETYLPNSNRYFRLVYISYHEGAPLIWEFRFYVKADGKVALNYIVWSEKNPFEYMSNAEMIFPSGYSK
jgi:hypothetical protein